MSNLNPGDKVRFLVPFENADARIEVGEIGKVKSPVGSLGLAGVIAKRILWLVKPCEVTRLEQEAQNELP